MTSKLTKITVPSDMTDVWKTVYRHDATRRIIVKWHRTPKGSDGPWLIQNRPGEKRMPMFATRREAVEWCDAQD